jgi:hypothetical protein
MALDSESSNSAGVGKNCGTSVSRQNFCANCGQKSDTHLLSFRELLHELADGLFDLDSRIWRSLLPLAFQPGKLTSEYLAGKRMRFLPPFRLYLILSLLFFFIPNNELDPDQKFDASNNPVVSLEQLGNNELASEIREEIQQEMENARLERNAGDDVGVDEQCNFSILNQDSFFTALVRNACLMMNEDSEKLSEQIEESIPIMMLLGLPLVALMMKPFYAFSGRYYIEHVIFLFHVHAFYFLISIIMSITSILGHTYGFLLTPMNWLNIIAGWYIPVYIFYAMKNVYGESGLKTFTKAFFLLIAYGVCIGMVISTGALFVAMSL